MSQSALALVPQQGVLALDAETEAKLAPREQRIRELVNVTRGCIIEIGRELIQAKEECGHGQFLAWIEAKFRWSQPTASRFMQVAQAFGEGKLFTLNSLPELTIDASALYLLSGPSVPQEIRDEAVERAEQGDHVTLADAERMVAEHVAHALDKQRAAQRKALEEAVKAATEGSSDKIEKLKAKLAEIKQAQSKPSIDDAIAMVLKITGKKKLSPREMQGLALALGTAINDGKTIHPAATPEETASAERNLQIASALMRALEYFVTAPEPEVVLAACLPYARNAACKQIPRAIEFLTGLNRLLEETASQ